MGESLVHPPETDYNKIGSYAHPPTNLSVSVSFGRFESDSLSWEKWSTFSSNKYLEEAEKFSRPGSVAQKKAYFEAHYKKIASKKDEFSDPEEENKASISGFHDEETLENCGISDVVQEVSEIHRGGKTHDCTEISQISLSEREIQEFDEMMFSQWPNEQGVFKFKEADSSHDYDFPLKLVNDVRNVDGDIGSFGHSSNKLETEMSNSEELTNIVVEEEMDDSFEHQKISEDVIGKDMDLPNDVGYSINDAKKSHKPRNRPETKPLYKEENMISRKKMQPGKIRKPNLVTRKNNMDSSPLKSLNSSMIRFANTRVVKSESTNFFNSSFLPASKKPSSSPMPRRRSNSVQRNNHSVSSSVHLPLPQNSISLVTEDSLHITRKSMIMERMADKEIVKRAFRTFQNDFDQLKISHANITSAGNQKMPLSNSRSIISNKLNQPKNKSLLPKDGSRVTSRSALMAEKPKELARKVEKKYRPEEREDTIAGSKHKDWKKDGEMKRSRQGSNFKATPMPRFYKGLVAPRPDLNRASSTT